MYAPLHRLMTERPQRTPPSHDERPPLRLVHPLDDAPEEKLQIPPGAGRMRMSRGVWWSLVALRAYLILIMTLGVIRIVQLFVQR